MERMTLAKCSCPIPLSLMPHARHLLGSSGVCISLQQLLNSDLVGSQLLLVCVIPGSVKVQREPPVVIKMAPSGFECQTYTWHPLPTNQSNGSELRCMCCGGEANIHNPAVRQAPTFPSAAH